MLPILPKIDTTTQVLAQRKKVSSQVKRPVHHNNENKSLTERVVKPMLPKLLVILGVVLVMSQAIPLAFSYYYGYNLSANGTTYVPVSESFLQKLTSIVYTDPGADWFNAVVAQSPAMEINTAYKKSMKLTIANAKLNRITLASNVPGNDVAIYDVALKYGVAHLKGTTLPGDPGISVVYGHSGVAGFFAGRSSPQIVFSRLDTVSIGDTMTIDREGKELRYVVSGKKIIEAQDLSFMSEQPGKERVILLTCWPLGIGTKRLIIIADRIQ